MRAVLQRVKESSVRVQGKLIGRIEGGILVLIGVADGDTTRDADYLAEKTVNLRIFEDENGRMNRSLLEIGAQMLVVSQFTLLADCRKGRRPSFVNSAAPATAEKLYEYFVEKVRRKGVIVRTGRFGAMMAVSLINDGPVTIILDSQPLRPIDSP